VGSITAPDRVECYERTAQQVVSRGRKPRPQTEQVDRRRLAERLPQARAGPAPKSLDTGLSDAMQRRLCADARSECDTGESLRGSLPLSKTRQAMQGGGQFTGFGQRRPPRRMPLQRRLRAHHRAADLDHSRANAHLATSGRQLRGEALPACWADGRIEWPIADAGITDADNIAIRSKVHTARKHPRHGGGRVTPCKASRVRAPAPNVRLYHGSLPLPAGREARGVPATPWRRPSARTRAQWQPRRHSTVQR
jgi:hypothetical protein